MFPKLHEQLSILDMNNNNNKNRNIIIILIYVVLTIVGFLIVTETDKYTNGKIPTADEDKYVIMLKSKVFKQAFKDNSWIDVVNKRSSRKKIELCIKLDSVYFDDLMFDKVQKTVADFPIFSWDTIVENQSDLLYFSLPIEKIKEKEEFDYVRIPTWLLTTLVEEEVLDMEVVYIPTDKWLDFWH